MNQLVREPVDLVRDECDEAQAGNQTFHFVFPMDLDAKLASQQVIEAMCPSTSSDDFHALLHTFEGNAIELCGAFDQTA